MSHSASFAFLDLHEKHEMDGSFFDFSFFFLSFFVGLDSSTEGSLVAETTASSDTAATTLTLVSTSGSLTTSGSRSILTMFC